MPNNLRLTDMLTESTAENLLRKADVAEVLNHKILKDFVEKHGIFPEEAVGKQNRAANRFDVSKLKGIEKEARGI